VIAALRRHDIEVRQPRLREQRYLTPTGAVVYVRSNVGQQRRNTIGYFFDLQPEHYEDGDWFIFACGDEGDIVVPGHAMRQLFDIGLHGQGTRPSFLFHPTSGAWTVYAGPDFLDLTPFLNNYGAVA
jgi:hypothetical protein